MSDTNTIESTTARWQQAWDCANKVRDRRDAARAAGNSELEAKHQTAWESACRLLEEAGTAMDAAYAASESACQSSTGTPVRDWCQVHGFNTQMCSQPA